MADPIAWLWQNGRILGDGCCQFYPTAERADTEIASFGGWKTPVFVGEHGLPVSQGKSWCLALDGLDDHRPADNLLVSLGRAAQIIEYMKNENTGAPALRREAARG